MASVKERVLLPIAAGDLLHRQKKKSNISSSFLLYYSCLNEKMTYHKNDDVYGHVQLELCGIGGKFE